MKLEFKPEDFNEDSRVGMSSIHAAHMANKRLAEMLAAAPTVYGRHNETGICKEWFIHPPVLSEDEEQTAKLVQIEEIKSVCRSCNGYGSIAYGRYPEKVRQCTECDGTNVNSEKK